MPRDGEYTLGDLIGKLAVLRVECIRCGRVRQYDVVRLVEELGPDVKIGDWLSTSAADCQHRSANGGGSCAVIVPDLIGLP